MFLKTSNLKLGTIETKIAAQAINENVTDLYLHGDVGDSWWSEGITAKKVLNALSEVETDTVKVHINTYGGDVFEGIAIYNILKQSEKTVITYVDGIAASAGSIIALAGEKLIMPENTQLMIHNPWTYARGNANEIEKVVDALRTTEKSIVATYMQKFVGTEQEVKELLEAEKFMTAEEALAFGFADEVIQDKPKEPTNASITERLMNKYAGQHSKKETPKQTENLLKNFVGLFEGGK